jgi:hypothetical protein
MTAIRRVLILIGLTLAVVVGSSIPASATFAESVPLPTTKMTTQSVPATPTPTVTQSCYWVQDPTTLVWSQYYRATVRWTAVAATRGHIGYAIVANTVYGEAEMARTAVGTLSYTADAPVAYLGTYKPTLSIKTLTSHGWTAESPETVMLSCPA